MKTVRLTFLALVSAFLSMASTQLVAQTCTGPSAVSFASYGVTCDFFNQSSTMTGRYDARTCSVSLTQTIPATCCNTFPTMTFILIGAMPILPGATSPLLVPGCAVGVVPFAVVPGPARGATNVLNLSLPAPVAPYTVYIQGVIRYFTTIGGNVDLQTTDVLGMTIS